MNSAHGWLSDSPLSTATEEGNEIDRVAHFTSTGLRLKGKFGSWLWLQWHRKKASGKSIGNQDKLAKLALEYSGVSHISCVASAGGYLSKNITDIHSIYTLQTARPHRERKATSQKYKSADFLSKVSGRTKRFLQRLMWVNHNSWISNHFQHVFTSKDVTHHHWGCCMDFLLGKNQTLHTSHI